MWNFTSEYAVVWYWQRRPKVLGGKPLLLPLCPPQIWCGWTWDWTKVSVVWGWWLSTCYLSQPAKY